MRILLLILTILPTASVGQWAPKPDLFTYDASFADCTADATGDDLVARCTAILATAFVLKREVALAFQQCLDVPLRDCAAPFENAGLPAFGAQIAAGIGCDMSDMTLYPADTALPPDHCVAITGDILADEGAIPLDGNLECTGTFTCIELAAIQQQLWLNALMQLENGPVNDPTSRDLLGRVGEECQSIPTGTEVGTLSQIECLAQGTSLLWRDLVLENQG